MKADEKIDNYFKSLRMSIDSLESYRNEIITISNILSNSDSIYICGNGGSAAMASHMANDLQKIGHLRAISLSDNVPLITAWSNDTKYEDIFVRQLERLSLTGLETIILISGSGDSKNLINAANWGLDHKKTVIAFIGMNGGELGKMDIIKIHIESDMLQSENWHCILDHLIARILENDEHQ